MRGDKAIERRADARRKFRHAALQLRMASEQQHQSDHGQRTVQNSAMRSLIVRKIAGSERVGERRPPGGKRGSAFTGDGIHAAGGVPN